MSSFLEELRARLSIAQKRVQVAIAGLQLAQQENQSAAQEVASLTFLIQTFGQREQAEQAAAEASQNKLALTEEKPVEILAPLVEQAGSQEHVSSSESPEVNKTDLVREQLRSHPAGIKPVQVWQALKPQIPNRSYVYAILGRLKAREEATVRRGKYFYRAALTKPERDQQEDQSITIQ
jgi:hypothetical protein